uniref:STAG domain-containing protein n=1 Tax=Rhodosorus marinus TaxID=101924 RepID=A0A7S3EC70_9RHOD|mmetsp:Transcript_24448/g.96442  ORF Transcript_24448/g.96442 Transcript_24448/m.96442 type:complete len:253 (+) Transcript_24448:136-894(+)
MSIEPVDDVGLYYVLRDHASSIGSSLRGFILKCKEGAPMQMYHLLELVTRSSYSNTMQESLFQLDANKVDELQADSIANDFTEFMGQSDVGSNILVFGSDAVSRKFQAAYEEFWRRFVGDYPPDDLIKSELFENLLEFLISLTESGSRSLRFLSCLTVYCMMDGLLEFRRSLKQDLNALEQKIGEETSTHKRRSSKKLSSIVGTLESAASASDKVEATSDRTFAEVFVHRSRDCFPDIRALSTTALSRCVYA